MLNLFNLFKNNNVGTSLANRPIVLISLDGWGLAPPSRGNAIAMAKTPNMNSYFANYPHGQLIASGESVGLPAGEVGNSEVGHLTMGVGRVIYQSLKRINVAISDGSFFDNKAFKDVSKYVNQNKSKLHLLGLVGSGNVHSSTDHLYALLQACKKNGVKDVYLHLFTDGRDAPPNEGIAIIRQIEEKLGLLKIGKIATISGRYYAMDRDARWERIQKSYDAVVSGVGRQALSALEAIDNSYKEGKTDEFIEPTVIPYNGQILTINDTDGIIFFNFRVDRAREFSMALTIPDFETADLTKYGYSGSVFTRSKRLKKIFFVSMTEYHKELPVSAVAFPPQYNFPDSLPEIMSKNNILNLHLAESEKERMVTYYFRGMRSEAFPLEDVVIVPSPKVPTYDKKPEMSAYEILKKFKEYIKTNKYGFAVLNFANPDMVAHSGNIEATIKAIEVIDKVLGELISFVTDRNGVIIITADHGNAEELLSFPNKTFYYTSDKGDRNTDHSSNPVPVVIIGKEYFGQVQKLLSGTLADIAPTILAIMKLPIPPSMAGRDLLSVNEKEGTEGNFKLIDINE